MECSNTAELNCRKSNLFNVEEHEGGEHYDSRQKWTEEKPEPRDRMTAYTYHNTKVANKNSIIILVL